ncbi:UDP-N-acetylglucosamine--N-acetylmuramyl-(pentapeptide) pyrophosphoryl-undecaprenol N-acetylglucosamine transferase [Helicobacter sp. MIT 05-5294]|uniref:UDP-N-acetylglucosamine--N-acetylmuramyl- (pentapeptide) pyrophosphoryl-undecaprenol N-acetylglucosamine transferase n=1 Tax=Helicobacter sp. MIT 05-5294 TaxID=1548150 RepID=UPI0010FD5679|nr:UDP-N-acetylglucosamine--N-acetylmuramyl-(pentapeptide) pyrophosphoryl-undecaprenol N-acetylglucosamine transferase [Helicobacter sp. MIT 05-5294]TLD87512.1 UDP-N-acetylglucosamine--N-acetylmuramyl-(pentapeptide) pyrophosphoryl-undecaprenol N-acetylglucosamine transferase [Helicobacter sp. MIT 05-5294]
MKIIITGGGTGGHLSVARAFLEEFHKQGFECIFIGSCNGQDKAYFQTESRFSQKFFLKTSGVVNKKGLGKIKSLWQQFKALQNALKILKTQKKVDFVLSVGGYSAAPTAFGAVLLRIPLFIHEQNAQIGRLNRILKPYAKSFFSSYLQSSPILFYPVSQVFFTQARVRQEVKNLLFMGGSQGARAINNFALALAEDIFQKNLRIFHQCGKAEFERVLSEYLKLNLKVGIPQESLESTITESQNVQIGALEDLDTDIVLFGFSKQMPEILKKCDFAICRAGASSLWELCANGLPALFVPYPYAAGNHQYYNAKFLEEKGLGFLCLEQDLFCEVLWDSLELLKGERISQISQELQKECSPKATEQIMQSILSTLAKNS